MGRNSYFQFKQFRIIQEKAAFKVGTDAVLLGAWVNVHPSRKILDVGTGTGVIALMMAQRSQAAVTGIDIESNAAGEAESNAKNSPWKERITILNASFQELIENPPGLFDLIISNPPFFTNSHRSKWDLLAMAKHNHLLPPQELVRGAAGLLEPGGRLAVILPADATPGFLRTTERAGLYLLRQTEVSPSHRKKPHRCLMEFGKSGGFVEKSFLNIHNDDHSSFTDEYKRLTRDFYLNF